MIHIVIRVRCHTSMWRPMCLRCACVCVRVLRVATDLRCHKTASEMCLSSVLVDVVVAVIRYASQYMVNSENWDYLSTCCGFFTENQTTFPPIVDIELNDENCEWKISGSDESASATRDGRIGYYLPRNPYLTNCSFLFSIRLYKVR